MDNIIRKKGVYIHISVMRICAFLLAISPILSVYASPIAAISFGEISMVMVAVLLLMSGEPAERLTRQGKNFLYYVIYAVIITIIMSCILQELSGEGVIKELLSLVVFSGLALIYCKRMDIERYIYMHQKIALIASVFLIIQTLIHATIGLWIPGMIPGVMSDAGIVTSDLIQSYSRASSFFKEPAHFAQYMAIPLATLLFDKRKSKKRIIYIYAYIIALAMSLSGNAMIILGITFAYLIMCLIKSEYLNAKWKGFLITLVGGIAGVILFVLSTRFQELVGRLFTGELFGTYATRVSGYIRVIRGYVLFSEFGIVEKIFGIGIGNYLEYVTDYCQDSLSSIASLHNLSYINGIQFFLTGTGIIGIFVYLNCLLRNIRYKERATVCVILCFIMLSAISGLFRGPLWVIFLMVILGSRRKENEKEGLR